MKPSIGVALLLATIMPQTANAIGRTCTISAYVTDQDPSGTSVRSAPNSKADVLARIPGGSDAVVDISGSEKGWFRVVHVQLTGDEDTTIFHGQGWIHASVLGMDVAFENPRLYAAPSARSGVIARLKPGETNVTLLDCMNDWAKVRTRRRSGWLARTGQCSSPLTNCS